MLKYTIHNSQTQKQTKCPLTEEWIKKMWYIYNGILLSIIKQNNAISSNMDTTRDYCAKWSKRKTNIWYHLYVESKMLHRWTYLWNRNKLTDIENRLWAERGVRVREGWVGSLRLADATIIQRMDRQWSPMVQHGELWSISCDKPQWNRKKTICVQLNHFAVQQD